MSRPCPSTLLGALVVGVLLLGSASCGSDDEAADGVTPTTGVGGADPTGVTAPPADPTDADGEVSDAYCDQAAAVVPVMHEAFPGGERVLTAVLVTAADPMVQLGALAPAGPDDYRLVADGFQVLADYFAENPGAPSAVDAPMDHAAYEAAALRIEATVSQCGLSLEP